MHYIPIAAQTQSKFAWWRIEPKNSAAFRCFLFQWFDHSITRPLWK